MSSQSNDNERIYFIATVSALLDTESGKPGRRTPAGTCKWFLFTPSAQWETSQPLEALGGSTVNGSFKLILLTTW